MKINTDKILNRPAAVSVTNTSGLAGIACWINRRFGLNGERCINKKHPVVEKIKAWVDAEYASGRVTLISDEELEDQIEQYKQELIDSGINIK